MNRALLALGLLSSAGALAVIQVDTTVVYNGQEDAQTQVWYVGDHIKRSCGDCELDGTIREIIGDVVTVHCAIKKGDDVLKEHDLKVAWGAEGLVACEQGEFKIKLTDLKDQHPKKEKEAA